MKGKNGEPSVRITMMGEDAKTGELILITRPLVQRRLWYKGFVNIPGVVFDSNRSTNNELFCLPRRMILGSVKKINCDKNFFLHGFEGKNIQKIEAWAYRQLSQLAIGSCLQWKGYFIHIDRQLVEVRFYPKEKVSIVSFYFYAKIAAKRFVLPKWANDFIREISDEPGFCDFELAKNGFPKK